MDQFNGLEVITNVWLTEPGPQIQVRRTLYERLFSRPWRPWQRTKTVILQVPRRDALRIGNKLMMHPITWEAFRSIEGASSRSASGQHERRQHQRTLRRRRNTMSQTK